jgi:hypothetical protein
MGVSTVAKAKKSDQVPQKMQETFDRITAITDTFAAQHLNAEYATLIRQATAALCRKRPSPLTKGRDRSWACGISHAIGMANFLFDASQDPHISASDLYAWFGVASSTGQGKSKQVRDMLDIGQLDPDWCLPSKIGDNPLAWMVSANGLILDARSAPPEVQAKLAAAGIIPYAPDAAGNPRLGIVKSSKPSPQKSKAIKRASDALYILEVNLVDGPLTESFRRQNPEVIRTLEIKGSQTLQMLHGIIFQAFDRQEEHLYEFQVGGDGPGDPNCQRYSLNLATDPDLAGEVAKTSINDLNLLVDQMFGYTFDFGDDWWHVLEVKVIHDQSPKGKYPKITDREGKSPPQYADFD